MLKRLALLALAVSLASCGGHNPPQPPVPSPSPSPSPEAIFPLGVAGTKFVTASGKPWLRIGAMECCNDKPTRFEWPLTSVEFIDLVASHGVNLVHIRIGPITKTQDAGQAPFLKYRAYTTHSSGRADLNGWNEKYWDDVDVLIKHALSRGVAIEVDLVDGWEMKEGPQDWIGHPWCLRFSVNPFNDCYANQLSRPPHDRALKLIDKAVQEWGDNPNVIWEISNESGVPGKLIMGIGAEPRLPVPSWDVTLKFEEGVVDAVRAAEAKYGYPRHLIGSNGERRKTEMSPKIDYIARHERFPVRSFFIRDTYFKNNPPKGPRFEENPADPQIAATKPIVINEWPRIIPDMAVPPGKDPFLFALEQAKARGTYWDYWRGDDDQGTFLARLAIIKAFRAANP